MASTIFKIIIKDIVHHIINVNKLIIFFMAMFCLFKLVPLSKMISHWEISGGVHFWGDHVNVRNVQWRSLSYLPHNVRFNTVLRSNREFDKLNKFEPKIEEGYLEWQTHIQHSSIQYSLSIKAGEIRYLRFPKPDIISMFDQVPGTEDLRFDQQTSYRGILKSSEIVFRHNTGAHLTALQWVNSEQNGLSIIESYVFIRGKHRWLESELRYGRLAERVFPLGRGSAGYSCYGGITVKGFRAGLLYEYLQSEGIRTGILVEFRQNPVNNWLGKLKFDYTRAPEGFVVQPTLFKGTMGIEAKHPLEAKIVGKRIVEQVTTYWQNGQGRNFYEHILLEEGETEGSDLVVTMEEEKRYLRIESLVSAHNQFKTWDDLVEWEKKRQGPAQLSRKVTYTFYKKE